jgi:hypothetical protein
MCLESIVLGDRGALRSRAAQILLAVAGVVVMLMPQAARAQTTTACGPEIKSEVAKALDGVASLSDEAKASVYEEIYGKYQFCAQDAEAAPQNFFVAARECGAAVSNMGSLFYEQMSCVGYDPQRRQFAAPIKIKQIFGFGPAPLPGSREYVLHCVADASGVLLPVALDSVHLADAIANQVPTWQFAVIANANQNLHTIYPMNGQTRRARSILSWALPPTNCNYTPIWGNALNYRIRLDQ